MLYTRDNKMAEEPKTPRKNQWKRTLFAKKKCQVKSMYGVLAALLKIIMTEIETER